ncbi:tryptophan-rich sensory protein [Calothrix sp. UHCC 0171]|uniref:tryptophan-rich sensory protein n=1 Tax=Calothrix sp. UHCC 0171 TaxID=3110245 RepID=UPI002B1F3556|nr:tryptophan-rich sensory protein [Calothrix sp. UHCC 0171]MEA5571237.1 tryptophan-rich sensory protein [Calothrix sp. UHCC 0171]
MQQSNSGFNQSFLSQLATLIAIIAAFVVNVWSNIFPWGGANIGEISNTLFKDVLIIPANYAFAIWGLIYLGLFAYGIFQLLPRQRGNLSLRKSGIFLIVACVAQIVWVYLFLARMFVFSIVAMLLILLSLIAAFLQLRKPENPTSRQFRWFAKIPISIYLGWISVATIVNVACGLYSLGWNNGATVWAIVMVVVASIVGFLMTFRCQDTAYTWVTVWALIAIAVKHSNNIPLFVAAIVCTIILAAVILTQSFQQTVGDSV